MDSKHRLEMTGLDAEDWEQTPVSVRNLVVKFASRIEQLEQQLKELQDSNEQPPEKLDRNSGNSHSPPASDPPNVEKVKKKKSRGKKRGGQPGHEGSSRPLYPLEECCAVIDHYPHRCTGCGEELCGEDSKPYRHQVVEIPPVQLNILEHRLHQRVCHHCGQKNRAVLPEDVETSGYGTRVVAIVSVLSGMYRHSHRMVASAMSNLFGVKMSIGTVNRLRREGSEAVSGAVEEAQTYVQQAQIVGADETGFEQGNTDGQNPHSKRAWLWVGVTPMVSYFQVELSRSTASAQSLLGENFEGIRGQRPLQCLQLVGCEPKTTVLGASEARIHQNLPTQCYLWSNRARPVSSTQKVFRLWHRVRDGTIDRHQFESKVKPLRQRVTDLLSSGANYPISSQEKTPLAKTVRTCRQLLKVEPALWLFVTVEGLEPTNNAAERAIRPAVLWRRTSFGSQSKAGSLFVARILTVVTSLRSQKRNVLDFMVQAIEASRRGHKSPSLLPQVRSSTESMPLVA